MSLEELLAELRDLGGNLSLGAGGKLNLDIPVGVLTEELKEYLRFYKDDLVELLTPKAVDESLSSWEEDSVLPGSFKFSPPRRSHDLKVVLLTGATGFLGKYLLFELLSQTKCHVYCLVRSGGGDSPLDRLITGLKEEKLWQEEFARRVKVIESDLSQSRLGLTTPEYESLAEEIDLILHNGARVHHGSPYHSLRATNVIGTQQLLEVAAAQGKPFHYVSSLSVLPAMTSAGGERFLEMDSVEETPAPKGGYNLTKWVGERLMEQAAEKGGEIVVYRPGPISGHSETGTYNEEDFLIRLVQGYAAIGLAPEGETALDVLPVDYVAKVIIWLAMRNSLRSKTLRRYHLLHPEPVSSELLFEACARAGVAIERVPYSQWHDQLSRIVQKEERDHPLYAIAGLFSSREEEGVVNDDFSLEIPYDDQAAQAALKEAPFKRSKLDGALFDRYLEAMKLKGGILE